MLVVLGKTVVTVPGTIVQATVNSAKDSEKGQNGRLGVQSFILQALPGNTGIVYVRKRGDGLDDRSNLVYTFGVLPAPADPTEGPFPSFAVSVPNTAASLNLADVYIDADQANDGVLISGTQQ